MSPRQSHLTFTKELTMTTTAAQPLHASRASSTALSARLWLSPSDRRRLTKLRDKVADLTGHTCSQSVLLRAGIFALDLQADQTAVDRKRQPETKTRRELQLLWSLAA